MNKKKVRMAAVLVTGFCWQDWDAVVAAVHPAIRLLQLSAAYPMHSFQRVKTTVSW